MTIRRARHSLKIPTALSAVFLLLGAMALAGVPRASAAPGDPPPPLSLQAVGVSPTLTFSGQQGQASLTLPVPQDLSPDVLSGVTDVPPFVTGGEVDVVQGDRVLSRTPISRAPNAPIALPLRGVDVEQNAAALTLRSYLTVDGTCQFDPDQGFRIRNATVAFTGREAIPQTVASFLPPILRNLAIYLPDDVQQVEGAAAVQLATAVAGNYGTADFGIEVRSLPRGTLTPPDTPGPLERQIVVNTSAPPGLTLRTSPGGAPYLLLGGPASQLSAQAQFLTSNLAPIAQSSAAVAGTLNLAPQLAPNVQTLADLGITNQTVTSAAWPSVSIGIDQTRLARPSRNIRVQLTGSYTPGPSGSTGVLSVTLGDDVIATIPTDSSGTFNQWVTLPDNQLERFNNLTVTLQRGDLREGCGNGVRSSLSVSASGEIKSEPADPPVPPGFGSLPQALMPRTQVAWTKGDVPDVSRAVSIMTAQQRLSAVPVGVDVVSVSDAASSSQPALIIAADGTGLPGGLNLPVTENSGTVSVSSGSGATSKVTLSPQVEFGSVQVTRSGDRSIVVATSTNDAADLDALLVWLGSSDRWSTAIGDAALKVAGNDPVYLSSDALGQAPSSSHDWGWAVAVGVVAGGLVLAALVAALTLRRRRADEPDTPDDAA
ncbi:hypothetical protein [Gordonia sp. NPDC003429]